MEKIITDSFDQALSHNQFEHKSIKASLNLFVIFRVFAMFSIEVFLVISVGVKKMVAWFQKGEKIKAREKKKNMFQFSSQLFVQIRLPLPFFFFSHSAMIMDDI